jgi:hypothetical protein
MVLHRPVETAVKFRKARQSAEFANRQGDALAAELALDSRDYIIF